MSLLNKVSLSCDEEKRLLDLICYEGQARSLGYRCIAGVDEAGRGPLAGPVYAAACIVEEGVFFEGVDDSKKLSHRQRESLYEAITSHPRVCYAISSVAADEIDRINIYQATIQAMLQAVGLLKKQPDFLLVDGLCLPHPTIPCQKIIKGDALSQSIAAASILAKVARDRKMQAYHEQWPHYGFANHKGYGTKFHLEALAQHGPCLIHRRSYAPVKLQGHKGHKGH